MAREDIRQRRLFHRTRSSSYAWPPFLFSLSPSNSSSFALLFIPSHSIATSSIPFTSLPPSLSALHLLPLPLPPPRPFSPSSPFFLNTARFCEEGKFVWRKGDKSTKPEILQTRQEPPAQIAFFSQAFWVIFFSSIVFTFLPKLDMGKILKNRKNILSKRHTIHFHSFPPPYQQDICSGILNPPLRPHI